MIETAYNIDDLLNVMVERNASDLHLTAGSPPVIRVTGRLERLSEHEATRLLGEVVEPGRDAELLERLDHVRDEAEGRADARALEVGVDTEAR